MDGRKIKKKGKMVVREEEIEVEDKEREYV